MLSFGIDEFLTSFLSTDLAGKINLVRDLKERHEEVDHVGYVSEPIQDPGEKLFAYNIDHWSLTSSKVAYHELGCPALLYKMTAPPLELVIPDTTPSVVPPPHIAYRLPDLESLQKAQFELSTKGLVRPEFMEKGPLPSRDSHVLYLDGVSKKGNAFRIELCLSIGATPTL